MLDTDESAKITISIAGVRDVTVTLPKRNAKRYANMICAKFPFTQ